MREFEDCVRSSLRELRARNKSLLQLCADAAEAVPDNYPTGIGAGVASFAARLDVSARTVERWREVARFWGRVVEFPPQGGLATVDYTALRDLPSKFNGNPEQAFAFLSKLVEEQKPDTTSGRWTRSAVFAFLPQPVETTKSNGTTTTTTTTAAKDGETVPPGGGAEGAQAGPPTGGRDLGQLDEALKGHARESGGASAAPGVAEQLRQHLEEAVTILDGLDDEQHAAYAEVEEFVELALDALEAVAGQLSMRV